MKFLTHKTILQQKIVYCRAGAGTGAGLKWTGSTTLHNGRQSSTWLTLRERFPKFETPHIEVPPVRVVAQLEYFKERHPIYGISSPALPTKIHKRKTEKALKRKSEADLLPEASPASSKKKKKKIKAEAEH